MVLVTWKSGQTEATKSMAARFLSPPLGTFSPQIRFAVTGAMCTTGRWLHLVSHQLTTAFTAASFIRVSLFVRPWVKFARGAST